MKGRLKLFDYISNKLTINVRVDWVGIYNWFAFEKALISEWYQEEITKGKFLARQVYFEWFSVLGRLTSQYVNKSFLKAQNRKSQLLWALRSFTENQQLVQKIWYSHHDFEFQNYIIQNKDFLFKFLCIPERNALNLIEKSFYLF